MRSTKWFGLSLAAALLLVLGCGGGGGSTPQPVVQVPTALSYSSNPANYTKGSAITTNTPSNSGGAITTYGVSPALPAGLNLNAATGAITGTPTAISAHAVYVVTGTNAGGSTSCNLGLTVNDVAPTGLAYTTSTAVYTKGAAIPANNPTSGGGAVVSYGISPSLPTGLSISTTTGVITGTPTSMVGTATYTVTATNSGGITTALLSITVNDMVPSNLTYASNPATYTRGTAIAANTPSSSGGIVVSYSITPTLPAGLAFSTTTGVISGTPTVVAASADYTVAATNSGGFTTASLTIAVNPGAATHFSVTGYPSPTPAGIAHPVTITVLDSANYTAAGYSGTVHFTSSDPAAVLPGDYFFSASDNGIKSVNCTLKTAGTQSITVTDTVTGAVTGSQSNIVVQAPSLTITAQPTNITAAVGATATFNVTASGTGYLSYQWKKNGIEIGSASSSSYTTPALILADSGSTYSVVVSDTYSNQVTSNEVTLTVTQGSFVVTGSLNRGRTWNTATRLPNGKVLVTGGDGVDDKSAEVFDPSTGIFTATGSMSVARHSHQAILLPNGKVLIVGGASNGFATRSAELYDPVTGTFSDTGLMVASRIDFTVTPLSNGQVLIAGGGNTGASLSSAEVYDPASGTFTGTGSLGEARFNHTATLLPNGKVLVCGGAVSGSLPSLASAELYDPSTGSFTPIGSMGTPREWHSSTLLPNGKVLITAGFNNGGFSGVLLASAELFDYTTGSFTATGSMGLARYLQTATLLANGRVLIAGGSGGVHTATVELYDPSSGTFTPTVSMGMARAPSTATILPNGNVLIVGGANNPISAELYDPNDPSPGVFTATGSLIQSRRNHTATRLPNGKILVAGGNYYLGGVGGGAISSAELFDPSTGAFTATGSLNAPREQHTATLLANGKVLISAGLGLTGFLATSELYDPVTGAFSATGPIINVRIRHTASLLPNGKVLLVGGDDSAWQSAELYDPSTGLFTETNGPITARRSWFTTTLLPNGKVLLAGGIDPSNGATAQAELFDPVTSTWSSTGSMGTARYYHSATLLPNGMVLVAGGLIPGGPFPAGVASAEIYDPITGVFTATSDMGTARQEHTATLLPNGKVLLATGMGVYSAELYDANAGAFSATGTLGIRRVAHTMTLLPNGKVLIVGGADAPGGNSFNTAEVYQ